MIIESKIQEIQLLVNNQAANDNALTETQMELASMKASNTQLEGEVARCNRTIQRKDELIDSSVTEFERKKAQIRELKV